MYWLIFRIFIYIIICVGMWYGGQFYSARETFTAISMPPTTTVFVDQNINTNPHPATIYFEHYDVITHKLLSLAHAPELTDIHTGTNLFPYITITDALAYAQKMHIPIVTVSSGIYNESFIVPDHIALLGQENVTISYDPLSLQNVIQTGDHSTLYNLHISGGQNAIMIPYNTSAAILNVTASDADDFGVLMGKSDRAPIIDDSNEPIPYEYYELSEEEINMLPHVYFRDVTIAHNKNQGMYLRDGRVTIENSHIIENGEEGIDLHAHMLVFISYTESLRNGESGLETEIYDNIVTITNSVFDGNIKNGIGFNTSYGVGDMIIKNSTITNNQQYGIRCARHTVYPDKPRPFFQSVITETNNIIENNAERNISAPCFLF